jgi:hypothetical protein
MLKRYYTMTVVLLCALAGTAQYPASPVREHAHALELLLRQQDSAYQAHCAEALEQVRNAYGVQQMDATVRRYARQIQDTGYAIHAVLLLFFIAVLLLAVQWRTGKGAPRR